MPPRIKRDTIKSPYTKRKAVTRAPALDPPDDELDSWEIGDVVEAYDAAWAAITGLPQPAKKIAKRRTKREVWALVAANRDMAKMGRDDVN